MTARQPPCHPTGLVAARRLPRELPEEAATETDVTAGRAPPPRSEQEGGLHVPRSCNVAPNNAGCCRGPVGRRQVSERARRETGKAGQGIWERRGWIAGRPEMSVLSVCVSECECVCITLIHAPSRQELGSSSCIPGWAEGRAQGLAMACLSRTGVVALVFGGGLLEVSCRDRFLPGHRELPGLGCVQSRRDRGRPRGVSRSTWLLLLL